MSDFRTRTATAIFFVVTVAITQMEATFALFMQTRHGYDAQDAGWILAFMGTIMVLIQGGLIGRLSKRFGESRLVLTGTFVSSFALVLLAISPHMGPVFIAMALLALGSGITNPSLSSLASLGSKPDRRGATMGIYHSAGSLARVFGPLIAGILYDSIGVTMPFLAAAAMMFATYLIYAIILFKRKQSTTKEHLAMQTPAEIPAQTKSVKTWVVEATKVLRTRGFKGLIQSYGWKLVVCFVAYYLIRDVTLYILLPWLIARGVLSL